MDAAESVRVTVVTPIHPARHGKERSRMLHIPFLRSGPVAMMLMGMALEALAKGVLSATGEPLTESGRLRKKWGRHNLAKLLETCGVALSDDDRELAAQLSEFVIGAGRYPVPRTYGELLKDREGRLTQWMAVSADSRGRILTDRSPLVTFGDPDK
jgi:hypothetical protein